MVIILISWQGSMQYNCNDMFRMFSGGLDLAKIISRLASLLKKNLNVSKPSEHPSSGEKCQKI